MRDQGRACSTFRVILKVTNQGVGIGVIGVAQSIGIAGAIGAEVVGSGKVSVDPFGFLPVLDVHAGLAGVGA